MLASILMESTGFIGSPDVSADALAKYGYNSEHQIAMESAIALNDIFVESFYKMEELDFKHTYATMEGASDVVLEGVVSSIKERSKQAIEKIKKFANDLWIKIKAFFNNIKRFLLGIFMNAEDFVKKYEKELLALTFKDKPYEVQMYDYAVSDNIDTISDGAKLITTIIGKECQEAGGDLDEGVKIVTRTIENQKSAGMRVDELSSKMDDLKGSITDDKIMEPVNKFLLQHYGKYGLSEGFTKSDLETAAWSDLRGGASDSGDMKTITITGLSDYVSYLKTSRKVLSSFDNAARTTDKTFSNTIRFFDDVQKKLEKATSDVPRMKFVYELGTVYCRAVSKGLTTTQGYMNTLLAVERSAIQEKIATYKRVCTGAFSHADKKDKKNK